MTENVAAGMEYLESKKCIHRLVHQPLSVHIHMSWGNVSRMNWLDIGGDYDYNNIMREFIQMCSQTHFYW